MMQYIYGLDANSGQQPDAAELMRLWGAFLLEIRKNVGEPKTTLSPVDILKPHIKDIDALVSKKKTP